MSFALQVLRFRRRQLVPERLQWPWHMPPWVLRLLRWVEWRGMRLGRGAVRMGIRTLFDIFKPHFDAVGAGDGR